MATDNKKQSAYIMPLELEMRLCTSGESEVFFGGKSDTAAAAKRQTIMSECGLLIYYLVQ